MTTVRTLQHTETLIVSRHVSSPSATKYCGDFPFSKISEDLAVYSGFSGKHKTSGTGTRVLGFLQVLRVPSGAARL